MNGLSEESLESLLRFSARRTWLALALLLAGALSACTDFKRFSYEGFDRDSWQKPDQVIQSLGIQPGEHVADIGAGGGYFAFRLADAVGPGGKVYAVDVDPEMVSYLREQAQKREYRQVEAIESQPHDPMLPEKGVDLIFLCNTYHHLQERSAYFARAQKYLRRHGRVAVVEFNREGWLQKLFGHATESAVIRSELEAAGYRLEAEYDYLPKQHFLVFSAAAD
jgi:ubiquinone/menaquinone biosynthesis C-methylase UbiE